MTKEPRKHSLYNMYHVVLQCQKENFLFGDDEDCMAFLDLVDRTSQHREEDRFVMKRYHVYAYCLVRGYAHLIVMEGSLKLADAMKSLTVNYSCYYNDKYSKYGNVFYGRYLSEPIESHKTFFNIFSFIHNLAKNEGLCEKSKAYRWSSWKEYFGVTDRKICDAKTVFNLRPKKILKAFVEENQPVECIDVDKRPRKMHDSAVIEILREMANFKLASSILRMSDDRRLQLALKAVERGLNPYQVARLCGITSYSLKKAMKE